MASKKLEMENLNLTLDVSELNSNQIRLIRSINTMLTHVLTTDDECDYFDGSSELLRMVASAVKQANFTSDFKFQNNIPYAEQALEFSMENLQDHISGNKVVSYDN